MKNLFLGSMLCLLPNLFNGQNIVEDIEKMFEAYNNIRYFQCEISVETDITGEDSFLPFKEAIVYKQGNNSFVKMGVMEQLQNKRCRILINHEQKHISYSEPEQESPEEVMSETFQSLIQQQNLEDFEFIEVKNNQIRYRIYQPGALIEKTEMFINSETYLLERLEYTYNADLTGEEQWISIQYKNNINNPVFKNGQFSEYNYIRRVGNEIETLPAYAHYNLLHLKNETADEK